MSQILVFTLAILSSTPLFSTPSTPLAETPSSHLFLEIESPSNADSQAQITTAQNNTNIAVVESPAARKRRIALLLARTALQASVVTTTALAIQDINHFINTFDNTDFRNIPCDIYCTSDFSFLQTWDFMPETGNLSSLTLSSALLVLHVGRLLAPQGWQKTIKTLTFPTAVGLLFTSTLAYLSYNEFANKRVDGFPAQITQALNEAEDATLAPALLGFFGALIDSLASFQEFRNA